MRHWARRLGLVTLGVTGCGRLGFEVTTIDSAQSDATPGDVDVVASPKDCDGTLLAEPVDNFATNLDGYTQFNSATTVALDAGQLTFTLAQNQPGSNDYAGVSTNATTLIRGRAARVELVQAPSSSFGAQAHFFLANADGELGGFRFDSGSLFVEYSGTQSSVPYDPVAHRWLRLHEAAGSVSLETSADGAHWSVLASYADPASIDQPATTWFQAGTFTAVAMPGQARFDNLNIAVCP